MRVFEVALRTSLALACTYSAAAQGSQTKIGGGCPQRTVPTVTGPLSVGAQMSIDDPGCFSGQGGVAVMFLGSRLPQRQWITLSLSAAISGPLPCDVVLLPLVGFGVSSSRPTVLPIPNNPALRGAQISLQAACTECGFAGCYDLLTGGLEITIG